MTTRSRLSYLVAGLVAVAAALALVAGPRAQAGGGPTLIQSEHTWSIATWGPDGARPLGLTPGADGKALAVPGDALWLAAPASAQALDPVEFDAYMTEAAARHWPGLSLRGYDMGSRPFGRVLVMHDVRWLDLRDTSLAGSQLESLWRMPWLEALFLSGPGVTDTVVARLDALESLRVFVCDHCALSDAGLATLARHATLEDLRLEHATLSTAGLAVLAQLPGLKRLGLADASLAQSPEAGAVGAPWLAALTGLEVLDLDRTGLGPSALTALAGARGLRQLGLVGMPLGDGDVAVLQGLRGLRALRLRGTAIGDAGLAALAAHGVLAQLTDLDLAGTRVTDAGVAIVARIPTLARLWLNDLAGVTDHGAAALRRARALVRVNLSGTAVSLTGADALRAERPTLDVIRW